MWHQRSYAFSRGWSHTLTTCRRVRACIPGVEKESGKRGHIMTTTCQEEETRRRLSFQGWLEGELAEWE